MIYAVQTFPTGLTQAFIIDVDFIANGSVDCNVGQNIFIGQSSKKRWQTSIQNAENRKGEIVFDYYVDDLEHFDNREWWKSIISENIRTTTKKCTVIAKKP